MHHRLSLPFRRHSGCSNPYPQATHQPTGVKTGDVTVSQKKVDSPQQLTLDQAWIVGSRGRQPSPQPLVV